MRFIGIIAITTSPSNLTLLRCRLCRNGSFSFFHPTDPFAFLLLPLDSAEGRRAQDADFERGQFRAVLREGLHVRLGGECLG